MSERDRQFGRVLLDPPVFQEKPNGEQLTLAQQAYQLNESLERAHGLLNNMLGEDVPMTKNLQEAAGGLGDELTQGRVLADRLVSRLTDILQRVGRL